MSKWTRCAERNDRGEKLANGWWVMRDGEHVGTVNFSSYGGTTAYNWRVLHLGTWGNSDNLQDALYAVRDTVERSLL